MGALSRASGIALALALAAALATDNADAAGERWRALKTVPAGVGDRVWVARVANAAGDRIEVYLGPDRSLMSQFTLREGLAALDPRGCPSMHIDGETTSIDGTGAGCAVESGRARATLGLIERQRIRSTLLMALMNGVRLDVRYRLAHGGYGSSEFSLKGSKQALVSVLGSRVSVEEEER